MIRYLTIRDLAVIDTLELTLEPGLNILSGETGAGKSIVVGALGLLRGSRASTDLVRTGAEKAVIEAAVEIADGTERVLRREVSAQGRSRAFIDDRLVSTATLRALGAQLLDLHGQHEHQALLDPTSHLDLLDNYAGLDKQRLLVRNAYKTWRNAASELEQTNQQASDRAERLELLAFQLRELDEVEPALDEDIALAAEQQILANADKVHRLAAESFTDLYDGDGAVLETLQRVWKRVEELAALDPTFAVHLDAKDTVTTSLEEMAFALRSYASGLDVAPGRLQDVENRLAKLEGLKRRFGPSLGDVHTRWTRLREEATQLESFERDSATLTLRVEDTGRAYIAAAETLSRQRRTHAVTLGHTLERDLADLAMPRTRFRVEFLDASSDDSQWTERGIDRAEFFFSANLGESPKALVRIVSGGELSRVMLALRTVTSADDGGKTLVFDEVDAGIGGEAADRVGAKLRILAQQYQILCVTHLPQIASHGSSHCRVDKAVVNGRTTTTVQWLDRETRAAEIARMMTGTRISTSVLRTARELLSDRGE
ncbi:MAG: DNA repair protein RecN [Acidobacteria bacterium]|nr:DNA repair protein RecN [Acidobacteriota bacterium]